MPVLDQKTVVYKNHELSLTLRSHPGRKHWIEFTDGNGARRTKSTGTEDAQRAILIFQTFIKTKIPKIYTEAFNTLNLNNSKDKPNPKIRDLTNHFLEIHLPASNIAKKTLNKYDSDLTGFLDWCKKNNIGRIQQVNRDTILRYTNQLFKDGYADKTIYNKIANVRSCFNAAIENELIEGYNIRKWSLPKVDQQEIFPLSIEELKEVMTITKASIPHFYPPIKWIALTGSRPSDVISLKFKNIDFNNNVREQYIQKIRKSKTIEISEEATKLVAKQKEKRKTKPEDYVFVNKVGNRIGPNVLYKQFTRCLIKAGYHRDVNLKDLRHTFGFIMANEMNCPLPILQKLMGHSSIEMTMKYVKPGDGKKFLDKLSQGIF